MKANMKIRAILNYIVIPAGAALILSGCAKEKEVLDKNLTKGKWTLSQFETVDSKWEFTNYTDLTPDKIEIESDSSVFINGVNTRVDYELTKLDGFPDMWTRNTHKSNATYTIIFNEEGLAEIETSNQPISKLEEENGVAPVTTNYTEAPFKNLTTTSWSWGNTTQQKSKLILPVFVGEPLDVIELTKTDLILEANFRGQSQESGSNFTRDYKSKRFFRLHFKK